MEFTEEELASEEWRDVAGFDGLYEVSNLGRVRGSNKRLLRFNASQGYQRVHLKKNGTRKVMRVHRLVLEAFVGPCPQGLECRHFPDFNKSNNRLSNISWSDHLTNMADRRGLKMPRRTKTQQLCEPINWDDVGAAVSMRDSGMSDHQIGAALGISQSWVQRIINLCSDKRSAA